MLLCAISHVSRVFLFQVPLALLVTQATGVRKGVWESQEYRVPLVPRAAWDSPDPWDLQDLRAPEVPRGTPHAGWLSPSCAHRDWGPSYKIRPSHSTVSSPIKRNTSISTPRTSSAESTEPISSRRRSWARIARIPTATSCSITNTWCRCTATPEPATAPDSIASSSR